MRKFVLGSLAFLLATMVTLLGVEVALRFLPVSSLPTVARVTSEQPVFRFSPEQDFVYSKGWNLALANTGKVNNAGFVNDQPYARGESPLLAVIGDSYVEAFVVSYERTLQARLARCVGDLGRVYSFAASGAPLSQYLAWAEHATRDFDADALVFVIIANDFDQSLTSYKRGPGFHHFEPTADGYELRLVEYEPNPLRWFVYNSALARYLVFNLNIQETLANLPDRVGRLFEGNAPGQAFVGNVPHTASAKRTADSIRAIDLFFEELPSRVNLSPERIVFVLDGMRPALYEPDTLAAAQDSFFAQMREYFAEQASAGGYELIDMQPIFERVHAESGTRFEFKEDAHWNAAAHRLVAERVARAMVVEDLFGGVDCS